MREMPRLLGGVAASACGTTMVLGLLLYMNQPTVIAQEQDERGGTAITTERREKPPQTQAAPPPRQAPRPQRRAPAPSAVDLSSVLGGLDFGLPQYADEGLGVLGDSLLGDTGNVVMTDESVDVPPRPTQQSAMPYPARAKAQGITGYVVLSVLISPTGQVEKVKVLESQPAGVFDETALQGVQGWRFEPATYKGEAVRVWARQRVRFNLS